MACVTCVWAGVDSAWEQASFLNTVFAVNKYNTPQLQLYRTLDSRQNKSAFHF